MLANEGVGGKWEPKEGKWPTMRAMLEERMRMLSPSTLRCLTTVRLMAQMIKLGTELGLYLLTREQEAPSVHAPGLEGDRSIGIDPAKLEPTKDL